MDRKRARNSEEDDDCMPISKRINRLQIDPQVEGAFQQQQQGAMIHNGVGNDQPKEVFPWQQATNNNYPPVEMRMGQSNGQVVMNPQPGTSGLNQPPNYDMFNSAAAGNIEQENETCDINCENYEPELDKGDNPHYFVANEVLFNAHTSRLKRQRTGMNRSFPNS